MTLWCVPEIKLLSLTYGCEARTLGKIERRKLEPMEICVWRRTMRMSWMDKKNNEQVLTEVNEDRSLLKMIGRRRKLIEHVL